MMELLNNLVLMGEAIVEFAKNLVIYGGSSLGGLALLLGGFKFLRKL